MHSHLQGIAREAAEFVGNDRVVALDIVCNDGTLLSCYPAEFRKVGVDPSDIARETHGDLTIVNDFFPSAGAMTESG